MNDGEIRVIHRFLFSINSVQVLVSCSLSGFVQFEWFHTSVKFSDGDLLSISIFLSLTELTSHYAIRTIKMCEFVFI